MAIINKKTHTDATEAIIEAITGGEYDITPYLDSVMEIETLDEEGSILYDFDIKVTNPCFTVEEMMPYFVAFYVAVTLLPNTDWVQLIINYKDTILYLSLYKQDFEFEQTKRVDYGTYLQQHTIKRLFASRLNEFMEKVIDYCSES